MSLVLSLFSGLGVLDEAFREQGWCVVSAGDVCWGSLYDVRRFHPPAGVFEGVIGGDPCQSHSSLANLVRAKGIEPRFPDLTPEVQRVIEEARPAWFLRENVPRAPQLEPDGYAVTSFLLDHSWLDSGDGWGHEQMRRRRFWFGWQQENGPAPNLMRWIRQAAFELPSESKQGSVTRGPTGFGASRVVPDSGRSAKVKVTAVAGNDGHGDMLGDKAYQEERARRKAAPVTGRNEGRVGSPTKDYSPPRRTMEERMRLQGLPPDVFQHSPFTAQGKERLVGNAVPLPMGREIARAVRQATARSETEGAA